MNGFGQVPRREQEMLEIYDYLLFVLVIIAFITDVKYHKLPNWLTAGGMAVGVVYHLVADGINGILFAFFGLLVGGGIFLILYVFKAIGAGDVKLFAAIGAFVGVKMVLYIMMYSIFFAGILAIIILLFTKTFMKKLTTAVFQLFGSLLSRDFRKLEEYKVTKATRFPFMYAVTPAIIAVYYYAFF